MKFKESKYYNKEFLGQNLYDFTSDDDEIFTVQEYFDTNDNQKEYLKEGKNVDEEPYSYKLKIYDEHYELNCQDYDGYVYLVFDKPVHIVGRYCPFIIAPKLIVKNNNNNTLSHCIADKVVVDNYEERYEIRLSKINNVYFYNEKIYLNKSEINNLFIFNPDFHFSIVSIFLKYQKIKCFGRCKNFKERFLVYKKFKERIIHIE